MYIVMNLANRGKKKTVAELKEIEDVVMYLDNNNIKVVSKPYIFTHINLSGGLIVKFLLDNRMLVSPEKLYEALRHKA